jgi:predicted nucleotidyltransferase
MTDSGGAAETRVRAMEDIRAIVTRLPRRELDIRRRCARDADFKSICMDYEEAARVLRYWQKVAQMGDRKKEADRNVAEYQSLLDELEAEILAHLNRSNAQQC